MGCGASSVPQHREVIRQPNDQVQSGGYPVKASTESKNEEASKEAEKQKKKDKKTKNRKSSHSSSSSSDSSDSDSEDEGTKDVITKDLLKEYLNREINMLTLELTQPEVVLKNLLSEKDQTTKTLVENQKKLQEQKRICMQEYQDLTNLQKKIQQRAFVSQDAWDQEQKEYVEEYNKHQQLELAQEKLQQESHELDVQIRTASHNVQKLLKLRKRQDHILLKTFDGSYGSEREAAIEEYVDRLKEFRKNILNTKTQWLRGLQYTKSANSQYWRTIQIWNNILKHPQPHVRWQHCATVTNFLSAAQQNSAHAVNCMKAQTAIPYFTEKFFREVDTSRRNAYTACHPQFFNTYMQWLWYYQQNAAYLEQWIAKTLDQTIEGDLTKVNGYLTVAEADLRAERKRLIIAKVKEKYGDDVGSEVAQQEAEISRLSEEVSKLQSVEVQTNVVKLKEEEEEGGQEQPPTAPPPAPTTEEQGAQGGGEITSELQPSEKGFGLHLADKEGGGVVVLRLLPGCPASACGSILVGDTLQTLNGVDVTGMGKEQVEELLKGAAGGVLVIVVTRREGPPTDEKPLPEEERLQEEAREAEERSQRHLKEANARVAELEAQAAALELESEEARRAQEEAAERRKAEEEAVAARVAAEEAAASAAAEQKEQLLREAEEAARAAEETKAEALKWQKIAEEAERKATEERAAHGRAAAEREEAEREAKEAEEVARKAKEDLERANAAAQAAKTSTTEPEKKRSEELVTKDAPMPDLKSDVDAIMSDYKNFVAQYEKKRGTEETRMDLDLQEKLKARRRKRRQQMKQKLDEQRLLSNMNEEEVKS